MENEEPPVAEIIAEGEISDEVDYAVAMFLSRERGFGLTAFAPRLVRLVDGREMVVMSIDSTFRGEDNKIYGYGEVGRLFLDPNDNFNVVYCTPAEEIERNREALIETVEPQERPMGKY